jgi:hypothetical protein
MLTGAFLLSLFWAYHSRTGAGGFAFWQYAAVGVGVNAARWRALREPGALRNMDPFFDDAQFESYRQLGEHSILKLIADERLDRSRAGVLEGFQSLEQTVAKPMSDQGSYVRNGCAEQRANRRRR